MKRISSALLLCLLALIITGTASAWRPRGPRAIPDSAPASEENLLVNGDFEGDYRFRHDPYTDEWAGELEVAEGWFPWYNNAHGCPEYDDDDECNPESYNRRPEYKPETNPMRVRAGERSHKYFTTYGTHHAGLYQPVEVPPDSWVRFSAWVMVWSSHKDDPTRSYQSGLYATTLGIDPTGGEDWDSATIQWTRPITHHDRWVYMELDAYTASGEVTVWTRGMQKWPVKHNDSYWDEARLVVLDQAPAPTATPTATTTPYPTPDPTAVDHTPVVTWKWRTLADDTFDAGLDDLPLWGSDAGAGDVTTAADALWLRNGEGTGDSFPLAWWRGHLPRAGDLRLAFRFAFDNTTAFGSTIGIGSQAYDGARFLDGNDPPPDIENVVRIRQNVGTFDVSLLGEPVWHGVPGDDDWHRLALEIHDLTLILSVDGEVVGRAVSYVRPKSLYLGNPLITFNDGRWTEVGIDDVVIEAEEGLYIPHAASNYRHRTATPTATTTPTATATPGSAERAPGRAGR